MKGSTALWYSTRLASPSVLPEKIFANFEMEAVRSLLAEAKRRSPATITWYSVAGPIHTNRSLFTKLGPDIMTIDYMVPVEQALEQAYPVAVNGNIRPLLFVEGNPDEIRSEAKRLLTISRSTERFILGAGCEIPLNATEPNIRALMEAAREEEITYTRIGGHPGFEVTILPHRIKTTLPHGAPLLDALRTAHVAITSHCNRTGSCGSCLVYLRKGDASPPDEIERHQLHAHQWNEPEASGGERLSCRARATEDVTIYIPQRTRVRPNSLTPDPALLETSIDKQLALYGFDPFVVAAEIKKGDSCPPSLPASILKRFQHLKENGRSPLYMVSSKIDELALDVTDNPRLLGLAIDAGTTSLTGYVIDLTTGIIIAVGVRENLQMEWGPDIISRAEAAKDPKVLQRLQDCLISGINSLIKDFKRDHSIQERQIYALTVVGNPVITHLFFGLDPEHLARAPFTSSISGRLSVIAESLTGSLRLGTNRRCLIIAPTSVKGFVGSDTVAGILSTGIAEQEAPSLFIDIGTNGEVVMGGKNGLYCTSVAAGPVFENYHMSCSVGYQRGVIDTLSFNARGEATYTTIGSVAPLGLCGPSIVDTLAEFIRHGIIDSRGRFHAKEGWTNVTERHVVIVPREATAHYRAILFTTQDIEEAQKALSALKTGLALLLEQSGIKPVDIRNVYISGSFGFSLNIENAIQVGMLPDWPQATFHVVRNSAGLGAISALLSLKGLFRSDELAQSMTHVNLAEHPDFFNRFIDNMFFPEKR